MASVHPEMSEVKMEDILVETGWGLYYKVLIGITSACAFCQSLATFCLTFALPLATCDSFIEESTMLTIILCFYLGKSVGGFLLNSISDTLGRLNLIPNTLMIIFGSSFLAAFSHSTAVLHIAAALLGSGIEANAKVTKIHLAEILPKKKRGYYLVLPDIFWTLAVICIAVFSWKLSQHAVLEHVGMDMRMTAWRLIFAIVGGCNLMMACASALAQPSPRFLLFIKQTAAANSSMKQFYAINKSKYSESWPLREDDVTGLIKDYGINAEQEPTNYRGYVCYVAKRMFKTACLLFKRRFIATTFALIAVKSVMFTGVIPLHIFLAKFVPNQNTSYDCVNAQEILFLDPPINNSCTYQIDSVVHIVHIVLCANLFIGTFMALLMLDSLGRKYTMVIGLLMALISSYTIGFWEMEIESYFYIKAICCSLILCGYWIAYSTINVMEIEAYPTAARGTAAGLINFYPNILFLVLFAYWKAKYHITFLWFGHTLTAALPIVFFLPEYAKRPMVE